MQYSDWISLHLKLFVRLWNDLLFTRNVGVFDARTGMDNEDDFERTTF
jgi:hypothetical protein